MLWRFLERPSAGGCASLRGAGLGDPPPLQVDEQAGPRRVEHLHVRLVADEVVGMAVVVLLGHFHERDAGLADIPPSLRESAEALGLSGRAKLWRVELPLASRSILRPGRWDGG